MTLTDNDGDKSASEPTHTNCMITFPLRFTNVLASGKVSNNPRTGNTAVTTA